jgi:hypothetical protein
LGEDVMSTLAMALAAVMVAGSAGFYDQGRLILQYEKGIQHFERLGFEALTRNERRESPQ